MMFVFTSATLLIACGSEPVDESSEKDMGRGSADMSIGDDVIRGFCCLDDAYHECSSEQSNAICNDISSCNIVASKNRVCGGNTNGLPIGSVCADSFECKGGACAFGDQGNYCTVTCNVNDDCPHMWLCEGANNRICRAPE